MFKQGILLSILLFFSRITMSQTMFGGTYAGTVSWIDEVNVPVRGLFTCKAVFTAYHVWDEVGFIVGTEPGFALRGHKSLDRWPTDNAYEAIYLPFFQFPVYTGQSLHLGNSPLYFWLKAGVGPSIALYTVEDVSPVAYAIQFSGQTKSDLVSAGNTKREWDFGMYSGAQIRYRSEFVDWFVGVDHYLGWTRVQSKQLKTFSTEMGMAFRLF